MDIAYLINNNGERLELKANSDNCENYKDRLICPYCGEKVDWFNGKKMVRHFRHRHSTYKKECEIYCSSISIGIDVFPYEREGLDIYLINDLVGLSLKIGLSSVSYNTIKEAERIGLVVNIEKDKEIIQSKNVDFEYFIPDEINFIGIKHISEQYNLNFSNKILLQQKLPREIETKWNEKINGIGKAGAIFSSNSYGGKKVRTSEGIIINEEYLLITKKKDGYSKIKGAVFEKIQDIDFGWLNQYYIFKFIIKEDNDNTTEFARKFDLKLKYKHKEIIPIWPPCSIIEDQLIFNYDSEKFFSFNTDNLAENKLYSHKLKERLDSQNIDDGKYLVKSCIKSNDYISVENVYNAISYSIVKRTNLINNVEPNIEIKVLNNVVNINTDVKIFVNLYSNKYLLKSEIVTNKNHIISLVIGQTIEILYGLDIIWENYNKPEKNLLEYNKQEDNNLLFRIKSCKGEGASIPTNLKWQILKLKNYKLSYKELIKIAKSGKVPISLINLIKDLI